MAESHCPEDGTELRDLSLVTFDSVTTGATFDSLGGATGGAPSTDDLLARIWQDEAEDDDPDLPEVLGGKWRRVKPLGEGTFGKFWLGQHAILGMQVGIKLLRRRFTETDVGRRLFYEEALRLGRLLHPNIVKLIDYGEEMDQPYLVMEFLQGKSLDRCLAAGEIGLRDAVDVVRQVATALVAAHGGDHTGRPLVHLDLKPEHVFLEQVQDRWHAKVIDFGIAEIVAATRDGNSTPDETHSRRIAGTLPYMAPERWKGVVDPRCDIYSLGVILYEVAAGRKPFVAKDPERLRRDHETKVPVPPSRVGPERTRAARALDGIVLGCLEKDPGARPQSAAELAESLERWIERPPVGFWAWVGQVAAIPVAVAAIVGVLILGYWAPWERISLVGVPPTLSTATSAGLAETTVEGDEPSGNLHVQLDRVAGIGYSRAFLSVWRLVNEEEVGHPVEVELRVVKFERGVLPESKPADFWWPQLADITRALGVPPDVEETVRASIVLRGGLGRSLASDAFDLPLDGKGPQIEKVNGQLVEAEAPKARLDEDAPPPQAELRFHEPFKPDAVILARALIDGNWRNVGTEVSSRDRQVLQCRPVPLAATILTVQLQDEAGNLSETKVEIQWRPRPPELVDRPPSPILTNSPTHRLVFRWKSKPGAVKARDDEGKPEEIGTPEKQEDGRYAAAIDVSFTDVLHGEPGTKQVFVSTWAKDPVQEPEPREDGPFIVKYLARDLKFHKNEKEGGDEEYEALASGKEADGLQWRLTAIREVSGQETDSVTESFAYERPLRLRDLRQREWAEAPGKYTVVLAVEDSYGNKSKSKGNVVTFYQEVDPPYLTSPVLVDAAGTPLSTIHHQTCECRVGGPAWLAIHFRLEWGFGREDLSWWLRVNEAPWEDVREYVSIEDETEGRIDLPIDKLFHLLREGQDNTFTLVACDGCREAPQAGDLASAPVQVTARYEPRTNISFPAAPADGLDVTSDGLKMLTIEVTGPPVKAVTIGGKPAVRGTDPGAWSAEVRIDAWGTTTVEAVVSLQSACEARKQTTYTSKPREGLDYIFDSGDGRKIKLRYCERKDGPFWYTPDGAWQDLVALKRGPEAARASWEEAAKAVERINRGFTPPPEQRGAGAPPGPRPAFRLPWLKDLEALRDRGLLPDGEPREWWLGPDDPECRKKAEREGWGRDGRTRAPLAQMLDGEVRIQPRQVGGGADPYVYPFFLVLPFEGESWFSPGNANRPDPKAQAEER